jgi:citrate lyase subunit beta/citryl-CoA lyase
LTPRSLLIVPGAASASVATSLRAGADGIIVDLTVAPARARMAASAMMAQCRLLAGPPLVLVRVNALDSGLIDDDLSACMPARPDGIVLPGAVGARDIAHLAAKLAVHEAEYGLDDRTTTIVALAAESAAAVLALPSLPDASPRLAAVVFDPVPLAADLGADRERAPVRQARAMLLIAARAAGVSAIEGPSSLAYDRDGLAAACRTARSDGFAGKLAREPEEVAIINAAFG